MDRHAGRVDQPPIVKPLDVDGVRTVAVITVLWAVAFVVLAIQRSQLDEADRGWWVWTCLAGVGLGLLGLEYCRKRRDAIARAELQDEADADFDDVRDWRDGELAQLAAEEHADLEYDAHSADEYADEPLPRAQPPYAEPLPGHPAAERFPPGPFPGEERPPVPQPQVRRPAPPQPAPEPRPVPPLPPEQRPPHPAPDQAPTYSPTGRPPPGYVTGDFPAVPAAPTAPAAPHQIPDVAAPAGYSPEPERSRRHPRDEELARRFQEKQARTDPGDTGPRVPADFLQDEPDTGSVGYTEPEPAYLDPEPVYREPRPPAYPDAGPHTGLESGRDTGYDEPLAGHHEPGREAKRPAAAESELLGDLLGDEPPPPSSGPDFLLDEEPPADRGDEGGEYRGRRARRD